MVKKKKKILIIEDDKFLLKLYSDKLRRAGFEVFEALTGEEGLNKISTENPDLIILDLILPRKSGFEILSELKIDSKTKDIPIIILTNLEQKSDIKRGLEMGAKSYLIKTDFSTNKLPQLVKENLIRKKK
jgi:DNA-binding response OmpR family regulator